MEILYKKKIRSILLSREISELCRNTELQKGWVVFKPSPLEDDKFDMYLQIKNEEE